MGSALATGLVAAAAELARVGLSPGATGNISVKDPARCVILCSPSGARLASLHPDRLSQLALDGSAISGPKATKEAPFHLAAYSADGATGAVIHLHSVHAVAVSALARIDEHDAIPAVTPYLTMKAGPVRLIPYRAPGSAELGPLVARAVAQGHRAMLLANHGMLVAATDLDSACAIAVELEEAAHVHLLTAGLPVRRLAPEDLADLR
jgi:ribulose-5-phosphate 4-epimerase/fuculose-1-phosphate aldolase